MKKNLWMLGVAVAALTSCTQSEVVEVANSKAIDFDVFTNKNTRAVEVLNDQTLTKIHIFGYETKTDMKSFDMPPIASVHHPFLNQLTTDGHLGGFHILATVNRATVNAGVHVRFQMESFVFSGCLP